MKKVEKKQQGKKNDEKRGQKGTWNEFGDITGSRYATKSVLLAIPDTQMES